MVHESYYSHILRVEKREIYILDIFKKLEKYQKKFPDNKTPISIFSGIYPNTVENRLQKIAVLCIMFSVYSVICLIILVIRKKYSASRLHFWTCNNFCEATQLLCA